MALYFNLAVCHSDLSDDSGWLSPMIEPPILHFRYVNMTSALLQKFSRRTPLECQKIGSGAY
jgi:hypothetical protein